MYRKTAFLFLLFVSEFTIALGQVNSDVFYIDLSSKDKKVRNITESREGYNNQPIFYNDDQILISSNHGKTFTDIFLCDLENGSIINITNTDSLNEYSPTLSPDKKYLYCVREENDSKKTQSMWKYRINNKSVDKGERVFKEFGNVGYFCFWGKELSNCAMFLVTQPISLQIVDPKKTSNLNFPYIIGRALKTNSDGDLYFTKLITEKYELWKMDAKSSKESKIIDIPSQDFTIDKDKIYTSNGSQILLLNKNKWKAIIDLKEFINPPITRLSINKNKIVFVTNK